MAKKGFLAYGTDDEDKPSEKKEGKSEGGGSAGEMYKIDLFEQVFEPSFDGDEGQTARKLKRIEALKKLMACLKE